MRGIQDKENPGKNNNQDRGKTRTSSSRAQAAPRFLGRRGWNDTSPWNFSIPGASSLPPPLPLPLPPARRGIASRRDRAGIWPRFQPRIPPPRAPAPPLIPHPAKRVESRVEKCRAGARTAWKREMLSRVWPHKRRLFHYSIRGWDGEEGKKIGGGTSKKNLAGDTQVAAGQSHPVPHPAGVTRGVASWWLWHIPVPRGGGTGWVPPPLPAPSATSRWPRRAGSEPSPGSASPAEPGPRQTGAAGMVLPNGGRVWGQRGHAGDTRGTRRGHGNWAPPRPGEAQQPGGCIRIIYFCNK